MDTTQAVVEAYKVLARKYRPSQFKDLVGQEPLVRTLSNAIRTQRVAHAFLLTGIRGVGKTTTARIIARVLNCDSPVEQEGEVALEPCGVCDQCVAIQNDCHPDVIEMDAASRTGVSDVREIIESVKYSPSQANYKIYIIDEVHMLSTSAFNALLKTLEEPPAHVKFIFATTEIRKIPVTIISRCQRFDLKRIDTKMLGTHLASIGKQEGVSIEENALSLITNASEGSVRDALSLLDQAISFSEGTASVSESVVRDMLGTADRSALFSLYEKIMGNETKEALGMLNQMYENGGNPLLILQDLLDITHIATRCKLAPDLLEKSTLSPQERDKAALFAQSLSIPILSRAWQILLKGLQELQQAPNSLTALEMILIRLAFLSNSPSPEQLYKKITQEKQGNTSSNSEKKEPSAAAPAIEATADLPVSEDIIAIVNDTQASSEQRYFHLVNLFKQKDEQMLYHTLYHHVGLVGIKEYAVDISLDADVNGNIVSRMSQLLSEWTGQRWLVMLSKTQGALPLAKQQDELRQQNIQQMEQHPTIQKVMETFPTAKIIELQPIKSSSQ